MQKQSLVSRHMLPLIRHATPQKQAAAALRTHKDRPSVTSMESKFAWHHANALRWNQLPNPSLAQYSSISAPMQDSYAPAVSVRRMGQAEPGV